MKQHKFECPFINSAGERCIVVVVLSDCEALDCRLNPGTADNIARAYAACRALQQLPAGFDVLDLVIDQIRSVH
jgi:hypothetical protein